MVGFLYGCWILMLLLSHVYNIHLETFPVSQLLSKGVQLELEVEYILTLLVVAATKLGETWRYC